VSGRGENKERDGKKEKREGRKKEGKERCAPDLDLAFRGSAIPGSSLILKLALILQITLTSIIVISSLFCNFSPALIL